MPPLATLLISLTTFLPIATIAFCLFSGRISLDGLLTDGHSHSTARLVAFLASIATALEFLRRFPQEGFEPAASMLPQVPEPLVGLFAAGVSLYLGSKSLELGQHRLPLHLITSKTHL